MRLTQALLDANPDLAKRHGMKVGSKWPCVRTDRIIRINEELLSTGYGVGTDTSDT
jgi:hypothetical protein